MAATGLRSAGADAVVPDILVCLKWVDLRPEVDPLTGEASSDARFSGAGPADLAALEWGLRFAERLGGTVSVATVGPPEADPMLRSALAVGASRAVLVTGGEDRPSAEIAARLAAVAADADLVCCGVHSVDRGSGAVPAFLAAALGIPQALGLVTADTTSADSNGGRSEGRRADLVVERRLDHGRRERLAVIGRCVLSFEGGVELRRAPLAATLASRTASIETIDGETLPDPAGSSGGTVEPTVTGRGPYRPRTKVKPPPIGPTRDRIASLIGSADGGSGGSQVHELPPADAARLAVERLVEWGYVEPAGGERDDPPGP